MRRAGFRCWARFSVGARGSAMKGSEKAGAALAIVICLVVSTPADAAERTPVATTPHFAFYSDLDTNLNDALIAAGVARKAAKPELFHSEPEEGCFAKLPSSSRAA